MMLLLASLFLATHVDASAVTGPCGLTNQHRPTITRDNWGIAHIRGHTDADAVTAMMYAQAEDDFPRIETNYLSSLGRLAEARGEAALWQDLRQRLFIDPDKLRADYQRSPNWLKRLMQSWAAGLNCYLLTHPDTHPSVLTHFDPWMALSFTEGSIGGDIERVPLPELEAFYGGTPAATARTVGGVNPRDLQASNGIAIAPARTKSGHTLLLINPHTSFYFRAEQQVTSDEGLNAYGASTWGQFFIYQGFNSRTGWMHTSSGVDNVDEFAETIVTAPNGTRDYRFGAGTRPVASRAVTLSYRKEDGSMAERTFTTYSTHHGPIIAERDGKWIAVALMNRPIPALEQSFLRTKTADYSSFLRVAQLKANSSNNTVFADSNGDIAYLHPQFVPIRDHRFNYRRPVDGSDPAADWKGLHDLASLPHVLNPANGWVMNTNNWPWTAAGKNSPRAVDFPRYMDQAGENPRGLHAQRLLEAERYFTPESLIAAAFDPYLTTFARLIPALVAAYDRLPQGRPERTALTGQIELLRTWDYRWSLESTQTSLAVFWGEALWAACSRAAKDAEMSIWDYAADRASDTQRLAALGEASRRLLEAFGSWRVPWGDINRFQRNDASITPSFSDARPSIAVPFTSTQWGSLATFEPSQHAGTKRRYGISGNSFEAVVEFGPKIRAWAVTTGGESGSPSSAHFRDQERLYASGHLRAVYFYPSELKGHAESVYRPGDSSTPH
jgi:acyl-homoserine-lactone acylase